MLVQQVFIRFPALCPVNCISISFVISQSYCTGLGKESRKKYSYDIFERSLNLLKISFMENLPIEEFGRALEGNNMEKLTLTNKSGVELKTITYGGRIISLKVPDRKGNLENVVLGFDALEHYLHENAFLGALVGRFANRIAKGEFRLDGEKYSLVRNDGANHLHGGQQGFDKVVWKVEERSASSIKLSYTSEDMEEGYPGRLKTFVTYRLNDDNSLDVLFEATTDKKTIINLTQHTYFNLSGDSSRKILDHVVHINADHFLPLDRTIIPTGEIKKVEGTPFDFRVPKTLGKDIEDDNEQIRRGVGYNHCWVLNDYQEGLNFAASAYHPQSGRFLEVYTTEPGLQLYTGNHLDGALALPNKERDYENRTGFCLETQHYPDSPSRPEFPSVVLEPGSTYSSQTSFRFTVK